MCEMFMGSMTDQELDDAMSQLDTSEDDKVDFAEFRKYWFENIGSGGCVLCPTLGTDFCCCG